MCGCVDVKTGTYSNTINLGYYPCMREYRDNRAKGGLPPNGICVDRCISEDVIQLWEAGVRTAGSCCGHNKTQGMINVFIDDYEKALALGFEPYLFDNDADMGHTVKPKYLSKEV